METYKRYNFYILSCSFLFREFLPHMGRFFLWCNDWFTSETSIWSHELTWSNFYSWITGCLPQCCICIFIINITMGSALENLPCNFSSGLTSQYSSTCLVTRTVFPLIIKYLILYYIQLIFRKFVVKICLSSFTKHSFRHLANNSCLVCP